MIATTVAAKHLYDALYLPDTILGSSHIINKLMLLTTQLGSITIPTEDDKTEVQRG